MAMSLATNVVQLLLPGVREANAVRQIMSHFGEISEIEAANPGHTVTYFDLRSTDQALKSFGGACWPAPPTGDRTVRLPGTTKLDKHIIDKIAGMTQEDDGYVLQFFDVRD